MREIFFITTRNIINTSGELRLIKNRGEAFYLEFGIETRYFALSPQKRTERPFENLGKGSQLKTFFFKNLWEMWSSSTKLFRVVKEEINKDDIIIVSGYLPSILLNKLGRLNNKIFMDIHGTLEELNEYGNDSLVKTIKNKLKYRIFSESEKRAVRISTGIITVSKSLKEDYKNRFGLDKKPIYVVPCGGNAAEFDIDLHKKNRKKWRKKLGVDKEVLFIYSGGVSPWQSIDKVIELYLKLKDKLFKECRLLIMSGNLDSVKKYACPEAGIEVRSFMADQVNEVLCAGDVGMLLRENTKTNNMAFPNKFYEYVLSGMYIICSQFIFDQADIVRAYNIGTIYEGEVTEKLIKNLECVGNAEKRKKDIDKVLQILNFKNTLGKLMEKFNTGDYEEDIFNS